MPLQCMWASDRLPSGMNYHRFLARAKVRRIIGSRKKNEENFIKIITFPAFPAQKSAIIALFIRLFIRLCFVLMKERAPDAHAPEAPESFNI